MWIYEVKVSMKVMAKGDNPAIITLVEIIYVHCRNSLITQNGRMMKMLQEYPIKLLVITTMENGENGVSSSL